MVRKNVKISLLGGEINPFHLAENVPGVVHAPGTGTELLDVDENEKKAPSKTDAMAIVESHV